MAEQEQRCLFRREGVKLTFMPVIAEASAKALAEYPLVNSSVDGYNIILKKHIHIGFAVSLPDGISSYLSYTMQTTPI